MLADRHGSVVWYELAVAYRRRWPVRSPSDEVHVAQNGRTVDPDLIVVGRVEGDQEIAADGRPRVDPDAAEAEGVLSQTVERRDPD